MFITKKQLKRTISNRDKVVYNKHNKYIYTLPFDIKVERNEVSEKILEAVVSSLVAGIELMFPDSILRLKKKWKLDTNSINV